MSDNALSCCGRKSKLEMRCGLRQEVRNKQPVNMSEEVQYHSYKTADDAHFNFRRIPSIESSISSIDSTPMDAFSTFYYQSLAADRDHHVPPYL